ncbi:MAG: alpha/beta fold hydrolase, partial [Alphaproteobacteria bacterium]|nr:alpha/beta fold hydrolase [Alphaproteobacteria bacterium]
MRVLAFSGWAQSADALKDVLPDGAHSFDYGAFPTVVTCFDALRSEKPDVVIGWSLGGQVALRAITDGVISPRKIILLSTHYQAAKSEEIQDAAPPESLVKLLDDYIADRAAMLKPFYLTCAYGDSAQRAVMKGMQAASAEGENWLYWLEELVAFSCETLDYDKIPPATLIYGEADCIVPVSQAHRFAAKLNEVR